MPILLSFLVEWVLNPFVILKFMTIRISIEKCVAPMATYKNIPILMSFLFIYWISLVHWIVLVNPQPCKEPLPFSCDCRYKENILEFNCFGLRWDRIRNIKIVSSLIGFIDNLKRGFIPLNCIFHKNFKSISLFFRDKIHCLY